MSVLPCAPCRRKSPPGVLGAPTSLGQWRMWSRPPRPGQRPRERSRQDPACPIQSGRQPVSPLGTRPAADRERSPRCERESAGCGGAAAADDVLESASGNEGAAFVVIRDKGGSVERELMATGKASVLGKFGMDATRSLVLFKVSEGSGRSGNTESDRSLSRSSPAAPPF